MKHESYEEFKKRLNAMTVTMEQVVHAMASVAAELGTAGVTLLLAAPLVTRELEKMVEDSEPVAEEITQGYREGEAKQ